MNKNKLYQIELARTIACLLVIIYHVIPFWLDTTGFYKIRLVEKAFTLDGVPVFWMIFGYFLGNRKYANILKKSLFGVLLPGIITLCLYAMLRPWICGQSMTGFTYPYRDVIFNITHRGNEMTMCPHLWYVFRYFEVALLSFIWIGLCRHGELRKRCLSAMFVFVLLTTIGECAGKVYGSTLWSSISVAIMPIINWISIIFYILLGYELKENAEKIQSKSLYYWRQGLILFLGSNAVRLVLQYVMDRILINYADKTLMGTANIFSLISVLGLMLIFLSVKVVDHRIQDVIRWLGNKTFGIYLIHWAVMERLEAAGFKKLLSRLKGISGELLYSVLYAVAVFIISLMLVVIFQKVMGMVQIRFTKVAE